MSTMNWPNECPECHSENIGEVGFSRHCRDCDNWFASFITSKEVSANVARDKASGKVHILKKPGT